MMSRGEDSKRLFLGLQQGRFPVPGVYLSVVRQREYLSGDGLDYLPEIRRGVSPARSAGEDGVAREQEAANPEAQTTRGVPRGMQHGQFKLS